MAGLTFGSLFAGIGGIDLGLERAGMRPIWQVERDDFCQKVLAKHWPDVPGYGDVHDVGKHNLATPDLICGGFPCQPVSGAGKQKGVEDERWLWPQFARIVGEIRPRYIFVENVPGLLHRGMGQVVTDLATLGYNAEWDLLSAGAFGAPHRRDRIYIVAYAPWDGMERFRPAGIQEPQAPSREELSGRDGSAAGVRGEDQTEAAGVADTEGERAGSGSRWRDGKPEQAPIFGGEGSDIRLRAYANDAGRRWETEPGVGRVADGVPDRVDRLRALGNAVVPQVAEWIGRQIVDHNERRQQ